MLWLPALILFLIAAPTAALLLPARSRIEVDTGRGLARVRTRPLWGVAPEIDLFSHNVNDRKANLLQRWRDTPRLLHALLHAPKLVGPTRRLLTDLYALKPAVSRFHVIANAVHPTANLAIELAGQLPDAMRRGVEISRRDGLGLDVVAHFDLRSSPLALMIVLNRYSHAPAVLEFLRRLRGKPKP